MRKSIIASEAGLGVAPKQSEKLAITERARVEVTSEDPRHPVEDVFTEGTNGWLAGEPGEQTLRLIFDEPADLGRISLLFEEAEVTRTQEIVLRWKSGNGDWREIVRQQWNFSPTGSTSELETWQVKLDQLKELELKIRPDTTGGPALASLRQWIVA